MPSVANTQITRQPWDAGAGTATWDSPSATLTRSVTGRARALVTVGGWWDDANGTTSATPVAADNNGSFTPALNPTTPSGEDPVRVQVAYQFGPTVASHVVTPPAVGSFGDGHFALIEILGITALRTTGRTRSYHTFFGTNDPQNIETLSATTSGGEVPKKGDFALVVVTTDNDNAATYGWETPDGWTPLDAQAPNDNTGFFLAYKVLDADGHVSATVNWDDPSNSTNVAEIGIVVFSADAKEVVGQAGKTVSSPNALASRAFPANVTQGSMISVVAVKYHDTVNDPLLEADCTQSAGTATIGTITLDRVHTLATDAGANYVSVGIWSALVTADGSLTMQVGGGDANTYYLLVTDEYAGTWDAARAESGNVGGTATDSQTTADSGDATTAGGGLFIGALGLNTTAAPATMTQDAAFTSVAEETDGANNMVGEVIRRIVTTGTTDSASWSAISAANFGWVAVVQAYKQNLPTGPAAQVARPNADVSDGAWTPSTGADNYATMNETPASDAEFSSTDSNSTLRVGLSTLSIPSAGTQTFRFRANGSPNKKLIVRLIEAASTQRGTLTVDPLPFGFTDYSFNPSGITDYADLDAEFEVGDATSPPTANVTWGAVGTAASGTTSCAPRYPTGISAATSKIYCLITGRSNTANTAPTMPAGWTKTAVDFEGGTGTWGVDAGTRRVTLFRKDTVTGSESGTVTVSLAGTTANTLRASIFRVEVPSGYTVSEAASTGADTTSGTAFSVTGSSTIDFAANDLLLIGVAQSIDSATQSAQSITASGITFGTRTNRASTAVTNGNDHRHILDSVPVSSGSGTVAPTYSYTASAAASGPVGFLRLRAVAPTTFGRVSNVEFEVPAPGGGGVSQDLAGSATAVASAAAAVQLLKALDGAAQAQAVAAASLTHGVPLSASAQAVATATAALSTAINMAAAAAALASATGQLSISVPLAGAMAALSTAGGTLSLNIALAAAAAAQAQASGTLSTQGVVDLQGAAFGQASAAGALSLSVSLLGAALGVATAQGSLSKSVQLQGTAAGQATAAAALSLGIPLSGAAQAVASATGALTASSGLTGAAVAVATATGMLSLSVALQGSALAQANASGALSQALGLSGTAAGRANAAGTLFLTVPLAGVAAGVASAAGGLVVTVQLAGAAVAQASAGGSLSVPVQLAGAAGGQAQATGNLFVAGLGAATATAYKARRAPRAWRGRQPKVRSWRAQSPARLWVARGTPT